MENQFDNQSNEQPNQQPSQQPEQQPEQQYQYQQPQYQQPPYQQPQYQQPYQQNLMPVNPGKNFCLASLILGILGIIGGWIPVVQWFTGLCSILAIIFGIMGRKKSKLAGFPAGMGTAGLILGIIAVALTVLCVVLCAGIIAAGTAYGIDNLNSFDINMIF